MVRRGEIFLADLGDPIGQEQGLRRPVLMVSANQWLASNPPVLMVVPLTRTYRQRSTHVEIEPGTSGLGDISYAKCEDLRSISPLRLGRRFGQIEGTPLATVDVILRRLLAL